MSVNPGVSSMQKFASGATRSADEGKPDYEGFICPYALERYAQYLHEHRIDADGNPRESDNWQKGMPRGKYVKSALRHLVDVWKAKRSGNLNSVVVVKFVQDAICAVIFNMFGLLSEIQKGRDVSETES